MNIKIKNDLKTSVKEEFILNNKEANLTALVRSYSKNEKIDFISGKKNKMQFLYKGNTFGNLGQLIGLIKRDKTEKKHYEKFKSRLLVEFYEEKLVVEAYEYFLGSSYEKDMYKEVLKNRVKHFFNFLDKELN